MWVSSVTVSLETTVLDNVDFQDLAYSVYL